MRGSVEVQVVETDEVEVEGGYGSEDKETEGSVVGCAVKLGRGEMDELVISRDREWGGGTCEL